MENLVLNLLKEDGCVYSFRTIKHKLNLKKKIVAGMLKDKCIEKVQPCEVGCGKHYKNTNLWKYVNN